MARVITALAGLMLAVAAFGLAMAPVFPLDKFIAPGIADFEARTGTVVESGATTIQLFPTPSVIAADVSITLPDGLGSVKADRLSLAVSPLPFLSGVARLSAVTLDKPIAQINLKDNDLAPLGAVTALTGLAHAATELRLTATDGKLDLDAGKLALSLDHFGAIADRNGEGYRLVLSGETAGTTLTLTAIAGQDGRTDIALATPAGELALSGRLGASSLVGRLALTAVDLARLGGPFASASGAASIEGALRIDPQRAELTDATATLFDGPGKLSAAIDTSTSRPSLDIHADIAHLPASLIGAFAAAAAERDPFAEPAPFDLGLDLKADELGFPGGAARNVHLTAVRRGASFGVVLDRMSVGNGSIDLRADLAPGGAERRMSGALTLDNIAVRDVATLVGATLPVSGRLAGTLRLSAHGRSMAELAATLAVDGSATLTDGRLASLPLSRILNTPALTALNANLSIIGLDRPARLDATAMSTSGPVTFEAETLPRRVLDGTGAATTIRLSAPSFTASFDGEGTPASKALEGSLSLTVDSLGNLLAAAPATKVSLDAKLDASPGRLDLSDVQLLIGDSVFAGLVGLATGGERDRLTGRLSGDVVDITALTAALRSDNRQQLSAVDADLRVEAGRIVAGPLAAAGGPIDLRLYRNGAEIGLPNLSLGGGSGSARITIAGEDRSALALTAKLEHTRLASLAPLIGSAVDGQLKLDLDLQGQGPTLHDLAASASGKADIELVDGRLAGIDPMTLLTSLAKSVQTGFGSGNTPVAFDRLSARVAVDKGVARVADAAFQAGDLTVHGNGGLTLADGSLDMALQPAIKSFPDFEVPVVLAGKPGNLRLYPKVEGLPDQPDEGYLKLYAMNGAFARLAGGGVVPRLKPAGPDAVASIIDTATANSTNQPGPGEASANTPSEIATPPLPQPKPANINRPRQATHPAASSGGPLDLGSLGSTSAATKPPAASCNPGRDGRCLP